jgi:XTP/dITP diphosphohydrolase
LENKPKLIIATSNQGKLKEFALLLPEFVVISQDSFGVVPEEEVGKTFVENSLHKARVASKATGLAALGDDSGLIVPALNNMPGLHSARYAKDDASDKENRQHLTQELQNINLQETKAYFVCVLTMIKDASDPFPLIATGILAGRVKVSEQGSGGFGYDPMFYPEGYSLSLAQITPEEKATLSHRGLATKTLRQKIYTFASL